MRRLLFLSLILLGSQAAKAQDFFSDRNNTGTPVHFIRQSDTTKILLFNAGVNVSDAAAVKLNIFNQKWSKSAGQTKTALQRDGKDSVIVKSTYSAFGWGAFGNIKTKAGLGKVFKSGKFDPGFDGGLYLALTSFYLKQDSVNGQMRPPRSSTNSTLILSGNIGFAKNLLYDPKQDFGKQLKTENFTAPSIGLGYVYQPALKHDNLFVGGSATYKRVSNYDDLDTYEIKNDSSYTDNGITRHATKISPDGDTYAMGEYRTYWDLRLRGNISYIPRSFNYRFGFNLYPSVDVGGPYAARWNAGVGFSYLKDNNPSLSIVSLNIEVNDIGDAEGSGKGFFKHSFKVGISTNLNLITGQ